MEIFLYREINKCDLNPVHHLFAAGTVEVGVEFACKAL